jgi:hypothetical protein
MGPIFPLAKKFMSMELDEVEKMLESPIHEIRVVVISIMDFQGAMYKDASDPPGMHGGRAANCRQDSQ